MEDMDDYFPMTGGGPVNCMEIIDYDTAGNPVVCGHTKDHGSHGCAACGHRG